ncbi:carbonic anhydrase [Aspergillus karnatakaensis]|uniref:carbonic anhydrase n=1 Tax=Aspergillus karnatakaensis TaxID=1810916 RepID=UPI003CCD9EB4
MAAQDRLTTALRQNKAWATKIAKDHPDFFGRLAIGQSPEILWIGCSDSRCPETTLLGLNPGDVFVHRNIANILHPADLSSSAVIEYSVRHLGVKHVVVCGHTKCGGIAAAMGNTQLGILDPWLSPLRQLKEDHADCLQNLSDERAALKLVELNVLAGVRMLKQKSVVVEAMQHGLKVHGLIYDVGSGVLQEVDTREADEVVSRKRFTSLRTNI